MPSRLILTAALIAGISYYFADAVTTEGVGHLIWKGSGVGLLALWAASRAADSDGWLLAAILACGAIGDVVIEAVGLAAGAAAFLIGHLVAVALYVRNQRPVGQGDIVVAAVLLVATPVLAASLPADRSAVWGVGVYAAGLGAMAATAWTSRFSRSRVGIGAVAFVISDLLIFASIGPLHGSQIPDIAIWPLYFAGQALIATGAARALRR